MERGGDGDGEVWAGEWKKTRGVRIGVTRSECEPQLHHTNPYVFYLVDSFDGGADERKDED